MSIDLSSFCDDFYVDMNLNTILDLPSERDTILSFFERIEKQFSSMNNLHRNNDEYSLEEDRSAGQYRWVSLESDRISAGAVNPASFEDAYALDRLILELAPYMLSVSHLDVCSLDVSFVMDFDYCGNHDDIIAEALFSSTVFGSLLEIPGASVVDLSPSIAIGLTEPKGMQCRLSIDSKTSSSQGQKQKQRSDDAISLIFTVSQFPQPKKVFDSQVSFRQLCLIAEELITEKVIPNFARPLMNTISKNGLM